jgi:hypothetical protein
VIDASHIEVQELEREDMYGKELTFINVEFDKYPSTMEL